MALPLTFSPDLLPPVTPVAPPLYFCPFLYFCSLSVFYGLPRRSSFLPQGGRETQLEEQSRPPPPILHDGEREDSCLQTAFANDARRITCAVSRSPTDLTVPPEHAIRVISVLHVIIIIRLI